MKEHTITADMLNTMRPELNEAIKGVYPSGGCSDAGENGTFQGEI